MKIDLHSHTTCSDGSLSPQELVDYAESRNISMLSITDHDSFAAYSDLRTNSLELVTGIEFSTHWQSIGIHIVGLNIDLQSGILRSAVSVQQQARESRARDIAQQLEKRGVINAYEGAKNLAANENIGRPHFAQFLVETGLCKNMEQAFKKYLGKKKNGNILKYWAPLPQVITWIRQAGGIAVLAHPLTYGLTYSRLSRFLDEFIEYGGQSMEVISGQQEPGQTDRLARLCCEKGLWASCGSDFHRPDQGWVKLGELATLPETCDPVWAHF